MQSYLQFVFPAQISIERQQESDIIVPKFFTFMATDSDGFTSYFHCLIFYEQFTKDEIKNDFDKVVQERARKSSFKREKGDEDQKNNLNFQMKR